MTDPKVLDLRGLAGTSETIMYQAGGQFPVLAASPDGTIVGVLRGGGGHVGLAGRIEIVRSRDGGRTWTPPAVVADSDWDDRNPALGVGRRGTLVLAYHRMGKYDADGIYVPEQFAARGERAVEVLITRSHDSGLTWERPYPLGLSALAADSPYGKIVCLPDGTLLLALYGAVHAELLGAHAAGLGPRAHCSYIVRSHDDGLTWTDPAVIGVNFDETGLLVLPSGGVLAVMRGELPNDSLAVTRSTDSGFNWSDPVQLTGPLQHPADLIALADGSILLTYGNRNPPYRVEGRVSRDEGHTWSPALLVFSGQLYGYGVTEPRPTDLGYPSSVVLPGGQGVTAYYYTPSLRQGGTDRFKLTSAFYSAASYYAIAVSWREEELLAAIAGGG